MSQPSSALELADLPTSGWEPLDIGEQLDADYRTCTGWDGAEIPAGLCIVVARLAFTRGGRPLPPGGVLLEIDVTTHSTPPADGRYEFLTRTAVTPHHSGRSLLHAEIRLREPDGPEVADVTFVIRWPHG
jgi:hypothetical protein